MKSRIFTVLVLTGLAIGIVFPQSVDTARLDSLFNTLADKNKAMGSLTLSKNGTVLYRKAIGYSRISASEKKSATALTTYRIGSITKMFTATMIFQLIEEGKVALATPLDTFFPTIPNSDKITIGNLLNHRSGLHNFTDDPEYHTWMTQPKTQDEMLACIAKNKVDFTPNEKAAYSNSNYVVLGYVIEKITQRSYAENLAQRITSKIGLTHTYCGGTSNLNDNESVSYQFADDWRLMPETDMSIPGGAGSIVSTPTDLTTFIQGLFSLKLVQQQSLDHMKTITDGFGMGMFQIPFYGKKGYGHNGGIDGFASNVGYFPEDSVAVAYCTNGQVYPLNDILIGVLSIYFHRAYSIPTFNTVTIKPEDLNVYVGVYASSQIPLKITITRERDGLVAQATGQSSFPLEATEQRKFQFTQAGIQMEFIAGKNEMLLTQGGGSYLFRKEQ
jgi:D-alanyl-D-alanine carboxypeptidase